MSLCDCINKKKEEMLDCNFFCLFSEGGLGPVAIKVLFESHESEWLVGNKRDGQVVERWNHLTVYMAVC